MPDTPLTAPEVNVTPPSSEVNTPSTNPGDATKNSNEIQTPPPNPAEQAKEQKEAVQPLEKPPEIPLILAEDIENAGSQAKVAGEKAVTALNTRLDSLANLS